ncbi:MAG: (2Fe-2S)-binding protein [Actinomycetota bacterium]
MQQLEEPVDTLRISLKVNGERREETVPVRRLLSDVLRDDLDLTEPTWGARKDHHRLRCGSCTPGFLMTISGVEPDDYPDEASIREMLSGVLCRCTGYVNIVAAVEACWGRSPAG